MATCASSLGNSVSTTVITETPLSNFTVIKFAGTEMIHLEIDIVIYTSHDPHFVPESYYKFLQVFTF